MDFVFTDEQRMIAETAQAFFTENATSERTRAAMAADGIDHALWQAFCQELGLSGIGIPEAAGGAGLGLVELAIIAEAAGAQVAALPMFGSLALAAQAIAAGGSEAQREAWLPGLLSGETIAAHVPADDLVAEGDRLTGSCAFVAHGSAAQLLLVNGAGGSWLVRADAPGVTVTAQTTMDQTRPYARVTLTGAEGELLAGGRRLHGAEGALHHHLGCSAFAAHAVVSRRSLVKVDRDLPFEHAALFGCAVLTGVGAVESEYTGAGVRVVPLSMTRCASRSSCASKQGWVA